MQPQIQVKEIEELYVDKYKNQTKNNKPSKV